MKSHRGSKAHVALTRTVPGGFSDIFDAVVQNLATIISESDNADTIQALANSAIISLISLNLIISGLLLILLIS